MAATLKSGSLPRPRVSREARGESFGLSGLRLMSLLVNREHNVVVGDERSSPRTVHALRGALLSGPDARLSGWCPGLRAAGWLSSVADLLLVSAGPPSLPVMHHRRPPAHPLVLFLQM